MFKILVRLIGEIPYPVPPAHHQSEVEHTPNRHLYSVVSTTINFIQEYPFTTPTLRLLTTVQSSSMEMGEQIINKYELHNRPQTLPT